ncbi:hypothetical protein [Spiroplasma endosymbiont of Amphimallon solstitiale]
MFLKEKFKDKNNYEFIIEKPINDNVIAGTPDLVYLNLNCKYKWDSFLK